MNLNTKIDVHAHFVPDFYADAARDAGHLPGPDGIPAMPTWTPEEHLKWMAENNVSKSYLSLSSPGVYLRTPSENAAADARALCRRVNSYASKLKATYPERFGFFASLPLPDIAGALDEIEYCFATLDPKPDGVILLSNSHGLYFGDPAMSAIYESLDVRHVTIFEHPTMPCTTHSAELFQGSHSLPVSQWSKFNRPIAQRQLAAPMLDFPFETCRTFADLLLSGFPARFPNLRWIIPHAGGGLTSLLDRIITLGPWFSDLKITEEDVKQLCAARFYFDLAGPLPAAAAVTPLLRWVDYTRILYGSDVPFTPWAAAHSVAQRLDEGLGDVLGTENGNHQVQCIQSGNAQRLFSPMP